MKIKCRFNAATKTTATAILIAICPGVRFCLDCPEQIGNVANTKIVPHKHIQNVRSINFHLGSRKSIFKSTTKICPAWRTLYVGVFLLYFDCCFIHLVLKQNCLMEERGRSIGMGTESPKRGGAGGQRWLDWPGMSWGHMYRSDHVCMGRLLSARAEGVIGIRGTALGVWKWCTREKVDWRRHHYLTQTRVILKRAKWHSFKLAAYELCGIAFVYIADM